MESLARLASLGIARDQLVSNILKQSPDCIKMLSFDGTLKYMNPNGQVAMEIEDFSRIVGVGSPIFFGRSTAVHCWSPRSLDPRAVL